MARVNIFRRTKGAMGAAIILALMTAAISCGPSAAGEEPAAGNAMIESQPSAGESSRRPAARTERDCSPETVQAVGVGTAHGTPDTVEVTLRVESGSQDYAEAVNLTSAAAEHIQQQARTHDATLRTEAIKVTSETRYDPERANHVADRFRAEQRMTVTLKEVSGAPGEIASLLSPEGARANIFIDNVRPYVSDQAGLRARALDLAAQDMNRRAQLIAASVSRSIERLTSAREDSYDVVPRPHDFGERNDWPAAEDGTSTVTAPLSPVPTSPGQESVQAVLQGTFLMASASPECG